MVCTRLMNEKTPAETVIKETNNNISTVLINSTIKKKENVNIQAKMLNTSSK